MTTMTQTFAIEQTQTDAHGTEIRVGDKVAEAKTGQPNTIIGAVSAIEPGWCTVRIIHGDSLDSIRGHKTMYRPLDLIVHRAAGTSDGSNSVRL